MLEPGGEPDLALEALGAERRGELGVQHLERDRPVVPQVVREVDGRHPAPAQLALERVSVRQRRSELDERISVHALPSIGRYRRSIPTPPDGQARVGRPSVARADRAHDSAWTTQKPLSKDREPRPTRPRAFDAVRLSLLVGATDPAVAVTLKRE